MQCAAPMVSFMSVHTSGAVIILLIFINQALGGSGSGLARAKLLRCPIIPDAPLVKWRRRNVQCCVSYTMDNPWLHYYSG